MESIFIKPSSLPGGHVWHEACQAILKASAAENGTAASNELLSEAIHCSTSPTSGLLQVFTLLCVYGLVLFRASQLIAHGSELLLLVPSLRGVVGSVILPILGAVPDGAIVLFSGLGENAQEKLSVGVGALAGSTSMLLTVPWFLSVFAGRVNIRPDGVLTYNNILKLNPANNVHLTRTGVQPQIMVKIAGRIMFVTAISYFVIQVAAFSARNFFTAQETQETTMKAAALERLPAFVCLCVCLAFFFWYLYYQFTSSTEQEKYRDTYIDELKQKYIRNGEVTLSAAFREIWDTAVEADESSGLIVEDHKKARLAHVLKAFFNGYDDDNSRSIDKLELQYLLRDLGEHCSAEEITNMYHAMDTNNDGKIEIQEFVNKMPDFIRSKCQARQTSSDGLLPVADEARTGYEETGSEEEKEEVPLDLKHANPAVQIRKVMNRSFAMMACGTILVIIFSDPMVDVLSDVGERIGIAPFYISFILAPLASNASELIAAYCYALKKTKKTVTISFSTLLGAAIMNNTFVLAIFMILMIAKNLAWQFTAETIAILIVELVIGIMSQKKTITLRDGVISLLMFPISLLIIVFLKNVVGLD